MYDNLTTDDIVDVWSRVYLDSAIHGRTHLQSLVDARLALMLQNERKKPLRLTSFA